MFAGRKILGIALALLVVAPAAAGGPREWPMGSCGPGHTRCSEAALPAGPGIQWIYSDNTSWGYYEPASGEAIIADGRVFVADRYCITALSAETGAVLWRTRALPSLAPPAVADGTLYVGRTGGDIAAYNASNGSLLWTRESDIPGEVFQLVVDDDALLFGISSAGPDSTVLALDRHNASELWRRTCRWGGFAAAGGSVFVSDRTVRALNESTGAELWDSERAANSTLVASGGKVLFTSGRQFVALNQGSGSVAWTAPLGDAFESVQLAAGGERALVLSVYPETVLRAFDLQTGEEQWRKTWADMNSRPSIALARDGIVMAYDRSMPVHVDTKSHSMSTRVQIPARIEAFGFDGGEIWNYSFVAGAASGLYPFSLSVGEGLLVASVHQYSETLVRHIFAFGRDNSREDLGLSAVVSPGLIEPGDRLTVTVSLVNKGPLPAENVTVVLGFAGGAQVDLTELEPLSALAPGGRATFEYSWGFEEPNDYPVFVQAFRGDFAAERNSSDNFILLMPGIDRRINLGVSTFQADYYSGDDLVQIRFVIMEENGVGFQGPGLNFSALLVIDGTDRTTIDITDFGGYDEQRIEKGLLPGEHRLRLTVDSDNQINETDESDNNATRVVRVPAQARPPNPVQPPKGNVLPMVGGAAALMAAAAVFIVLAWRKPQKGPMP